MVFKKSEKYVFAKAVAADIPEIDYITKARNMIRQDAISQLPTALKKHINYLQNTNIHVSGCACMYVNVPNNQYQMSPEMREAVKELHSKHVEQKDMREAILNKAHAAVLNCRTIKQAKETLPEELHKFLPDEKTGINTTTALSTTQLVDDIKKLKAVAKQG